MEDGPFVVLQLFPEALPPQPLSSVTLQVWSLTQLYSVDFSQWRIDATKAQSRFASVVVDGVLGPPRLARHT